MAYDSFNQVTVMIGGFYGTTPSTAPGTFYKDVWHWTGSAWIRKADFSRTIGRPALAYDSDRHVFVMHGGNRDPIEGITDPPIGETWEYNAATDTWTRVSIGSGPPHSALHAMTYDSARRVMVLNVEGNKYQPTQLWEFNGATRTWTRRPDPPFANRNRVTMVFDGTRTLLYGGKPDHTSGGPDFADTWSYNGSSWTQITGAGGIARSRHVMVWDTTANVAIAAYGTSSTAMADNVSTFDGALWQLTNSDPQVRNYSAMAYQSHIGRSVMFGGLNGGSVYADTWSLTCSTSGSGGCTPGAVCRAAAGACDVAEICNASGACPADGFQSSGTVCRAAAGSCDVAETCSGSSASCPPDGFLAAGSPGSPTCSPYVCGGSAASCPTSCASNSSCASGYVCSNNVCGGSAGNLISNPSFESVTAAGDWGATLPSVWSRVTSPMAQAGTYSMKVATSKTGTFSLIEQKNVSASTAYNFSGYIQTTSMSGTGASFRLHWMNGTTLISIQNVGSALAGTNGWTLRSGSYTSPPNATSVKVELYSLTGSTGGTAYFDNLALVQQ